MEKQRCSSRLEAFLDSAVDPLSIRRTSSSHAGSSFGGWEGRNRTVKSQYQRYGLDDQPDAAGMLL